MLLDTHAFLWHLWDSPERSDRCAQIIADPANELLLSVGSCWEMAIKQSRGLLGINIPFATFIESGTRDNRIGVHAITADHLGAIASLPFHHRDPFDRLVVAQSLCDKLPLLSRDAHLDAYGVERLW